MYFFVVTNSVVVFVFVLFAVVVVCCLLKKRWIRESGVTHYLNYFLTVQFLQISTFALQCWVCVFFSLFFFFLFFFLLFWVCVEVWGEVMRACVCVFVLCGCVNKRKR